MSSLAYLYLWAGDNPVEFEKYAQRWSDSYLTFGSGTPHTLYVCACGSRSIPDCLKRLNPVVLKYFDAGWDLGAIQHCSSKIKEDFLVTGTARHYMYRGGALARMKEAFDKYGDCLAASSTSYENCPIGPFEPESFPNPHVRTCFFGFKPSRMMRYPLLINSRERGFLAESGEFGFAKWFWACGLPVVQVTWDLFVSDKSKWRLIPGRFRDWDQSAILVRDKHSDNFLRLDPKAKAEVIKRTWG